MLNKRFALLRWLAVAILMVALTPRPARACSCVVPGPPDEELAQSTAVFAGRVTDIHFSPSSGSSVQSVWLNFSVSRVWKGRVFKISQLQMSPSCGYSFLGNDEYLVYADGEDARLEVSLCSRTRLLEEATEDLEVLGEGTLATNRSVYIPTLAQPHDAPCERSLVGRLEENSGFSTLLQALEAANLSTALESAGPFTIFAPTDAAFDKLPSGAFEQLMTNPTGQLTQILLYHVLPGRVALEDLENNMLITTQIGKSVLIERGGDCYVRVNGARILTADLEAQNGMIHVIDTVILPPPD